MSRRTPAANTLFYGDNLAILREHIEDESVDLVYLDPPFNSNATYNVLFRAPSGERSQAQIEAFEDTWHWEADNNAAERAFDEVMTSGNSDVAEMLRAMRSFLKENDMMAYLTMMAVRLLELHRVLKPTGSLYLHCDPTASHYLKIVLDAIFGVAGFKNDIAWQRSDTHSDARRKWPGITDHLLFYTKSLATEIVPQYKPYPERTLRDWYLYLEMPDGSTRRMTRQEIASQLIPSGARRFNAADMSAPAGGGMAAINKKTGKPNGWHIYKGFSPPQRGWRYSPETMAKLDSDGLLIFPEDADGRIMLKRYLDLQPGVMVGDVWDDIQHLRAAKAESMGYPTQKPLALLERVIAASSNEGDLVLDPFCGCGTTVHAAQKLNRRWIGIDVTHLAIGLVKRRLIDAYPMARFDVLGVPKDLGGAQALAAQDKHQFELWALSMVEAQPYKGGRKGADSGIDGILYFKPDGRTTEKAIVEVKGGETVSPQWVRALGQVVERERAKVGILITLTDPTTTMKREAHAAGFYKPEGDQDFRRDYPKLQILTVEDLFDGKRPELPFIDSSVFRKAKRETTTVQGKLEI